ncbi:hypothetical protein [Clostridium cylindrosporum]|uniref:DUF2357 domain-containing protein n=1 Tax=Clostridium cylindrosporum DSM 605 TaxID=1121307 RepID=A0A0J8DFY4_CLOCY|nr:hypothetical protein [Clostridium cylindrosporum]KMT23144.1 hypothetical protein CLCY_6c00250 [Clostridium cylindrosporum DSM 605]
MDTLYSKSIKVRFIIQNFGKEYVQEVTKFHKDLWSIDDIEVVIKECSKVYIEFEANDERATLLVENVFQEDGEAFILFPGQSKMLFELDNNYSMLIPGSYIVKLTLNNGKYYSMFEIVPRHINDIQLKNLRDFVNTQISNLSYNMGSKLHRSNSSVVNDYMSILKQYNEFHSLLKYNLSSIMKNPYFTLDRNYIKSGKHQRIDRKVEYLNSKGNKNDEYSYKKVKDFRNKQNIIIKSIATKMLISISDIEEKLTYAYEQNKIEEVAVRKESEFKKSNIEKVKGVSFDTKEIEKRIKSYDQTCLSLGSVKKRRDDLKYIMRVLKGAKTTLASFIKSTYIKEVPTIHNINYKSVRMEDNRYKSILKIYNKIYLSKEKKSISYKPSELLYEYFVFLVVVKVFKDIGMSLSNCDFKDISECNFLDKIPKGCLARFINGEKEVRVWYEKEVLSMPSESLETGNGFYTHAPNRLPDIRVDYLENNSLKDSIIIESKYRRYSYLWSDLYNTNTMIQIKNYKTTIKYIFDNNRKPIYPIKKIIVVYPGQEDIDRVISKEWGDYTFLQLKPDESGEIYGFKDLENMLISKLI